MVRGFVSIATNSPRNRLQSRARFLFQYIYKKKLFVGKLFFDVGHVFFVNAYGLFRKAYIRRMCITKHRKKLFVLRRWGVLFFLENTFWPIQMSNKFNRATFYRQVHKTI